MQKLISVLVAAMIAALLIVAAGSPADARRSRGSSGCSSDDPDTQIAGCTAILNRSRVNAPVRSMAHNNRGVAYANKGDHEHAIRDFDEAIVANPKNATTYLNRGISLRILGQNERAIRDLDEAIRLVPRHAGAYNNRGLAYAAMTEYDRAIRDFDEAIWLAPKSAVPHQNRANALRDKGDADRALREYDEALRLDPKYFFAYLNRGGIHTERRDWEPALRDYDSALRIEPTNVVAKNGRGFCYKQRGDLDLAILEFDEVIRLAPNFAPAYSNRGDAWRQKGELERAIVDLGEAIRLDPAVTPAYVNRGLALEKKGDAARAQADYTTALSRPPGKYTTTKAALEIARERLAALGSPAPTIAPAPPQAAAPTALPSSPAQTASRPAEAGPRVALVIGNGAYGTVTPLPNPQNDARDIAGALRDLGFKVIEGYDLDGTAMRRRIAEFGATLPGAAVTLFYYAGHGLQVAGKNYLLPVDAKLERPSSLSVEAIEIGAVLADMEAEKRVNLVFLDACRDNPMSRSLARAFGGSRSGNVSQGLAQLNAGIGTLIAFATSPDTVALDGTGRNSPFTAALLKHIRTPALEIRSMLTRVRSDVITATRDQQVPWDHSSLTGDFYFRFADRQP